MRPASSGCAQPPASPAAGTEVGDDRGDHLVVDDLDPGRDLGRGVRAGLIRKRQLHARQIRRRPPVATSAVAGRRDGVQTELVAPLRDAGLEDLLAATARRAGRPGGGARRPPPVPRCSTAAVVAPGVRAAVVAPRCSSCWGDEVPQPKPTTTRTPSPKRRPKEIMPDAQYKNRTSDELAPNRAGAAGRQFPETARGARSLDRVGSRQLRRPEPIAGGAGLPGPEQYEKRRTLTFMTRPSAAAIVRMLEPP